MLKSAFDKNPAILEAITAMALEHGDMDTVRYIANNYASKYNNRFGKTLEQLAKLIAIADENPNAGVEQTEQTLNRLHEEFASAMANIAIRKAMTT